MAELEFSSLHLVDRVRQNTCYTFSLAEHCPLPFCPASTIISPRGFLIVAHHRFTWRSYCSSHQQLGLAS